MPSGDHAVSFENTFGMSARSGVPVRSMIRRDSWTPRSELTISAILVPSLENEGPAAYCPVRLYGFSGSPTLTLHVPFWKSS